MNTEIFDRIRREIILTVEGARETVITLADRVNRKTQALKLHWQAAEVTRQIAHAHQQIGSLVAEDVVGQREPWAASSEPGRVVQLQVHLEGQAATIKLLKEELNRIDRRIAEIEAENLSDDLLRVQLDLTARSLSIERVIVAADAPAVAAPLANLALSPGTRVLAVFRGPALLADHLGTALRSGDIVVLLGARPEVQQDRAQFNQRQRATA